MREHDVEKVEKQPLCHDATFIDPSTDPDGAEAVVLVVFGTPNDGDVPFYNASNNRVEWRAPLTADDLITEDDELVIEDGNILTET